MLEGEKGENKTGASFPCIQYCPIHFQVVFISCNIFKLFCLLRSHFDFILHISMVSIDGWIPQTLILHFSWFSNVESSIKEILILKKRMSILGGFFSNLNKDQINAFLKEQDCLPFFLALLDFLVISTILYKLSHSATFKLHVYTYTKSSIIQFSLHLKDQT